MMGIKGDDARRTFLVFSLQCCSNPLNRIHISSEDEARVKKLISDGMLPEEGFEQRFREAYPFCSIIAAELGKGSIDLEVVEKYFYYQHNYTLDHDLKEGLTFRDSVDCKVYPGRIISMDGRSADVLTPVGTLKCDRQFVMDLPKDTMVAVHRGVIAKQITPEDFHRMEMMHRLGKRSKSKG